jgi:micrococcal nuclease
MLQDNFETLVAIALLLIPLFVFPLHKRRPKQPDNAPAQTVEPRFDGSTATPAAELLIIYGPARVVDGDTIVINKTSIRLFGIDAPEMNHPYGQKAKWAMVNLCKGQTIRSEITETDAHGRSVGKCSLPDGRDLSAEIVKLGLAIDWPKFSGGIYKALEVPGVRKKLWLADARQKGRMHVWEQFDYEAYRAQKAVRK